MNSILKFILKPILGKKKFQTFFESLHLLSLKGMNYGFALVGNSGEASAFKLIKEKYFSKNKELIIFDVGANEGDYCEMLLANIDANEKIYAFEPSKKTFAKLTERVKSQRIVFENLGLSESTGEKTLFVNSQISGLASVYNRNTGNEVFLSDSVETITVKTLDQYCKEKGIQKINFLKLDVEGHELSVLNGAKEMLLGKKIDVIQFEFGGTNIDSKTFLKDFYILLEKDFDFYRILQNGLKFLGSYKELNEIFFTVNFIAIKKNL